MNKTLQDYIAPRKLEISSFDACSCLGLPWRPWMFLWAEHKDQKRCISHVALGIILTCDIVFNVLVAERLSSLVIHAEDGTRFHGLFFEIDFIILHAEITLDTKLEWKIC